MSTMERKINIVLQRSIEGITSWLSELLSRQKKNDFRPKDEEGAMMSMGNTTLYAEC